MILEHALLAVTPGREEEFEASMSVALGIISSYPGCRAAEVRRQIEDPSTYVLLVHWDSVSAHVDDFRNSADFEQWRELTHPYYVERPVVTHFDSALHASR
ncbi:MAG: antibiotic biosynthesis monooxygenase family protein [Actinomycetota bacterium]